jgi:hypothetical protein
MGVSMKKWLTMVVLAFAAYVALSATLMSSQRVPWYKDSTTVRDLQLNDNQIKLIERAVVSHLSTLDALRAELEKQESALQSLIGSHLLNDQKIQSQVDVVLSARRNLERENTALSLDIRHILSLEQWQKLQLLQSQPAAIREAPPQRGEPAAGKQQSATLDAAGAMKKAQPKVVVFQNGTFITSDFSQGVIHQIGNPESSEGIRGPLPNSKAGKAAYIPQVTILRRTEMTLVVDSVKAGTIRPECVADLQTQIHNVGSERVDAFVLVITASLKSGRKIVADHFYDASLTLSGQKIPSGGIISQILLPVITASEVDQISSVSVGVDLVCYPHSCIGPDQTRHADVFSGRTNAVQSMKTSLRNLYQQRGIGAVLELLQSNVDQDSEDSRGSMRFLKKYWLTIYNNRGLAALLDELR